MEFYDEIKNKLPISNDVSNTQNYHPAMQSPRAFYSLSVASRSQSA